jgi:low affinity Fe/Cu permease
VSISKPELADDRQGSAHFSLILAACLAGLIWCAGIGALAFEVQQEGFAPVVIFPLAVGAAVGLGIGRLVRFSKGRSIGRAVAVAALGGLLAVLVQDYIAHRHRVRLYEDELARHDVIDISQDAPGRPAFSEYLAAQARARPGWFAADVVLTSAGAACTAVALARRKQN